MAAPSQNYCTLSMPDPVLSVELNEFTPNRRTNSGANRSPPLGMNREGRNGLAARRGRDDGNTSSRPVV